MINKKSYSILTMIFVCLAAILIFFFPYIFNLASENSSVERTLTTQRDLIDNYINYLHLEDWEHALQIVSGQAKDTLEMNLIRWNKQQVQPQNIVERVELQPYLIGDGKEQLSIVNVLVEILDEQHIPDLIGMRFFIYNGLIYYVEEIPIYQVFSSLALGSFSDLELAAAERTANQYIMNTVNRTSETLAGGLLRKAIINSGELNLPIRQSVEDLTVKVIGTIEETVIIEAIYTAQNLLDKDNYTYDIKAHLFVSRTASESWLVTDFYLVNKIAK